MKRHLLSLFLIIALLVVKAQGPGKKDRLFKFSPTITAKDYLPNRIIVKFKSNITSTAKTSSTSSAASPVILRSASVLSVTQKFPESKSATSKTSANSNTDEIGINRIYDLKIGSGDVEKVINELLLDPNVEYAEPKYIYHTSYDPNDPAYRAGDQSYLNVIKAPQAWNLVRNGAGVIIAIVDTGSEFTHPDLAANIYHNTADPINGIDDDRDGFTDNFNGWDFAGACENCSGDNDPGVKTIDGLHGIHVSGLAGAVTDNNIGVASTSFNTAKLMIVKAGPDNAGTSITEGFEAIKYAADHGANIINCSWGSTESTGFARDVVNYAIGKGCLIVAAAGNTGTNQTEYPAGYRGVFSIANTDLQDRKSGSSTFGANVTLSAPGQNILSTYFGGQYSPLTGTSMSTPIVSSAAALVKSAFPNLTMLQVGELLRVTADKIDAKNPQYAGLLGSGRVNVFRALTESYSSVRIQDIRQDEKRASATQQGDTVLLYFDIKSFLNPVTNLQLTLSTQNPKVSILTSQVAVGSLATLESKMRVGPFKVLVPAGVEANTEVEFRLNYSANSTNGTYQEFESFSIFVARDYLDIYSGNIATTITSNGRIGFSNPPGLNGLGFVYRGSQLLYEAALMIGKSSTQVSNNARVSQGQYEQHFVKIAKAQELANNADSIKAESKFDDRDSPNPLNVSLTHSMVVYQKSPDDKYAIAEYQVFNNSNTPLRQIYIGLFTDWDILGGALNSTEFDSSNRLGYVYEKQKTGYFAGVKLLSKNAPPVYYPLTYQDNFTTEDKWRTLSSGIKATTFGTGAKDSLDVSFVSGNGPYDIPANGSIKIAFALIGGDNLADLEASGLRAQTKYDLILASDPQANVENFSIMNYPNPVITGNNSINTVRFTLPEDATLTLELYNLLGQKVVTLFKDQSYGKGIYERDFDFASTFTGVNSGIYFYRLKYNNGAVTSKVSVLR